MKKKKKKKNMANNIVMEMSITNTILYPKYAAINIWAQLFKASLS